jgi:DHA1 family purine base/nucleoside efflux pump-like MFS transporter
MIFFLNAQTKKVTIMVVTFFRCRKELFCVNPRVFILAIATFVVGTVELIIGGTMNLITADLNIPLSAAGQLITVFSLSFAVSAPILMHVTRKIARKRLYLLALFGFFLSNVLAALSPVYSVLLIARILSASCGALLTVLSISIATQIVEPAYRGRALGIIFMGISGSLVLGVPMGMTLGNAFGWRAPFWLIAGLSLVAMLCLSIMLPNVQTPPAIPLRQQLASLKSEKIVSAQLITMLMLTGHLTLYAYFTPFLQETMQLEGAWLSFVYLLFGVAAVMGGGVGGWISDKWGPPKSILVIVSAFGLVMASLPFTTGSLYVFLIVMVVWSALSWAISPAQQNYLIQTSPRTADILLGLNTSVLHVGIALGSAVGGIVIEKASVQYNAWVGACFVLVSLGCAVFSITRPGSEKTTADAASTIDA